MRAMYAVSSLIILGLVLYALGSFAAVSFALRPNDSPPEPPPLPLAQAAPEVAQLRDAFRVQAALAQESVPLCPNRDARENPPRPRGKVLIWDVAKDDVSEAHGRLPAELRLRSLNDPCTVYLITERERQAIIDYSRDMFHGGGRTGVQGFRTDLVVCAVDLPSQEPRGRFRVSGNGPPLVINAPEPNVNEIDEDWAGNLKRWLDTCVHGPEARYFQPSDQAMCRHADEARTVIDQCEMLGSLPTLGNMPRGAIIYNLQTDCWHTANGTSQARADFGADKLVMVLPLEEMLVRDERRGTGRFDFRVALVAFPGAQPLGVYQVQGEDWPLPKKPGDTWAPSDPNRRNPDRALAAWVERLCAVKRGLPAGTISVAGDATHLAGTDWLKGPGWLKYMTRIVSPDEQGWAKMAEQCSEAVADCRALGSAVPRTKLPARIVVWTDFAATFFVSLAQKELPKALQAGHRDSQLLMVLLIGSDYVLEPKDAPQTERFDTDVALFTMPGAQPVGVYRVRGETLTYNRPRSGPGAKNPDTNKDVAAWLTRFLESPAKVARESAMP